MELWRAAAKDTPISTFMIHDDRSDRTGDPLSDCFRAMPAASVALDYMVADVRSAPSGLLTAAGATLYSARSACPSVAPPACSPPSVAAPLTDKTGLRLDGKELRAGLRARVLLERRNPAARGARAMPGHGSATATAIPRLPDCGSPPDYVLAVVQLAR